MSYSSLWTIDKNWSGKEHKEYSNSWLFPPTIWNILFCKYIRPEERRRRFPDKDKEFETTYMGWTMTNGNERWAKLNGRINNSAEQVDRVLWELSMLSVFNAKDKEFVADCIERFIEVNFPDSEYKESEHIKERFREVAKDIRELPNSCKYFVFKGTSCDDNVERWFYQKRLSSWDEYVCEFTLIEDGRVVGFSDNLQVCKKD